MVSPEVVSRAAAAPKMGQGLGSTIWYEWAWWAIRCFLVNRGLGVGQIHKLGLWLLLLLEWLVKIKLVRLGLKLLV